MHYENQLLLTSLRVVFHQDNPPCHNKYLATMTKSHELYFELFPHLFLIWPHAARRPKKMLAGKRFGTNENNKQLVLRPKKKVSKGEKGAGMLE